MPDTLSRSELRQQLRERRKALPEADRESAARALIRQVSALPLWPEARWIAGYWPNDGEVDPRPLLTAARDAGKRVCLPVLASGNNLHFHEWSSDTVLLPNRLGIPEPPDTSRALPAETLDILLMPLVGWSRDGTRLGMGGGFYDRSLAGIRGPLKVGLAFVCQEVGQLSAQPWDIPMDYVVTETALHDCRGQTAL